MAKLRLNTTLMETDFFSGSSLYALGATIPAYTLCWWMNRAFGLEFVREPELDVCVAQKTAPTAAPGLFSGMTTEVAGQEIYYPVFRQELYNEEAELLLYTNRNGAARLLPEIKHADYLLLVKNAAYLDLDIDWVTHLHQLNCINWVRAIDLPTVTEKNRLIV